MDFASRGSKKMSKKGKNKSNSSLMKVVYISSPMKVRTSASRFRTLVQELTGRDSDISRYSDSSSSESQFEDFEIMPELKRASSKSNLLHQQQQQLMMQKGLFESSPSSSESMVEQEQEHEHEHEDQLQAPAFDDAFISEGFFQGLLASDLMFTTDSSNDKFDDVLGSYDSL